MPVTGQKVIADNIIKFGGGFLKNVNRTMDGVKDILDKKVTENISLTDHSLQELSKLDHPYAARHGSRGRQIHDPYYQVHIQSGKLLRSKSSGTKKAEINGGQLQATAFVQLDPSIAPHAVNVVYGTSKMIPRPILQESRREVLEDAVNLIKNNLKDLKFGFSK